VLLKVCLAGGLSQVAAPRQQSKPQADEIDGLEMLPTRQQMAGSNQTCPNDAKQ